MEKLRVSTDRHIIVKYYQSHFQGKRIRVYILWDKGIIYNSAVQTPKPSNQNPLHNYKPGLGEE